MTKDRIIQIRNVSFEAMLVAQEMMDKVSSPYWKNFAESLYEAHWANYQLLCDKKVVELLTGGGNDAEKEN